MLKRLRTRAAIALALTMAVTGGVAAQSRAHVAGTVRAQPGAPLPGVRVTVHPGGAATETDARGHFALDISAGAATRLTLAKVGFAPDSIVLPALAPGVRREMAITLAPLQVLDALTVVARRRRPLLNTEDAATGGAVEREELEALPPYARDPIALLFNVPGVAQSSGFFGDAPPFLFVND